MQELIQGILQVLAPLSVAAIVFSQALPILAPCVVTFISMAMAYMIWRGKHARPEGSPIPGNR